MIFFCKQDRLSAGGIRLAFPEGGENRILALVAATRQISELSLVA